MIAGVKQGAVMDHVVRSFAAQSSILASLLWFAHGAAAEPAAWQIYTSADDGFVVEFSGPVKVDPTAIDAKVKDRIVRSTNYLQDGGEFAFIVGASLMRYSVNFDEGVKASFATLKCQKTVSEADLKFPGGKAREVLGTDCASDLRVDSRYFTKAKWFYQVIALTKKDGGDVGSVRRFLESFKVTQK
jgi:hypothetical protein